MTTLELIDDLQLRYVRALDRKDLAAWLSLFALDGQYFLIPGDNAESSLPMGLMVDDCYERLVDRVSFVTRVWTFDDYQMRHFVQRMHAEQITDDVHRIDSNVVVFYTDHEGRSSLLAVGRYEDEIAISGQVALFKKKRMILDNFVLPMNIAYPL